MSATSGELVLVFDDGYVEDHDQVLPVLREADVPAAFAVVPEWVGDPDYVDESQLAALVDAGCEITAHGRRHRFLSGQGLTRDVAAGDERIYADGQLFPGQDHGVYPGDEFELTDGERRATVELAGKGAVDGEGYVETAAPVETAFDAGETVFRPTRGLLEAEITGTDDAFAALDLDPSTFVFPYDAADARAWAVAADHYDAIPNASVRPIPNPPGTVPTNLRRYYLQTTHMTRVEIASYLDTVAEQGGLGILAGHSAWDSVPPERVAWVVAAAKERGIGVTTFRDRS